MISLITRANGEVWTAAQPGLSDSNADHSPVSRELQLSVAAADYTRVAYVQTYCIYCIRQAHYTPYKEEHTCKYWRIEIVCISPHISWVKSPRGFLSMT